MGINKYSEEELLENYNKFINAIKALFKNNPERLKKLLHMYSEEELGKELAVAPASGYTKYHNCYFGGYLDHVMNVVKYTKKFKDDFVSAGGVVDFTDEEMFFSAFHHDLGKLGDGTNSYYIPEESDWHRDKLGRMFNHNEDLISNDVGQRSLFLLNKYGIQFSEKEQLGIILANGAYDEIARKMLINHHDIGTVLPYIVHMGDLFSTYVEKTRK